MNLFPLLEDVISLLMASSCRQEECVINNASNPSFRMHIYMANYINSFGNKTKFKTKLTKLFTHKLVAKKSICHYF